MFDASQSALDARVRDLELELRKEQQINECRMQSNRKKDLEIARLRAQFSGSRAEKSRVWHFSSKPMELHIPPEWKCNVGVQTDEPSEFKHREGIKRRLRVSRIRDLHVPSRPRVLKASGIQWSIERPMRKLGVARQKAVTIAQRAVLKSATPTQISIPQSRRGSLAVVHQTAIFQQSTLKSSSVESNSAFGTPDESLTPTSPSQSVAAYLDSLEADREAAVSSRSRARGTARKRATPKVRRKGEALSETPIVETPVENLMGTIEVSPSSSVRDTSPPPPPPLNPKVSPSAARRPATRSASRRFPDTSEMSPSQSSSLSQEASLEIGAESPPIARRKDTPKRPIKKRV